MAQGGIICTPTVWALVNLNFLWQSYFFHLSLNCYTVIYLGGLGGIKLRLLGLSSLHPRGIQYRKSKLHCSESLPFSALQVTQQWVRGKKLRIEHSCLFGWNIYSLYISYWVLKSPQKRKIKHLMVEFLSIHWDLVYYGHRSLLRPPDCPSAFPAEVPSASETTSLLLLPSR